MYIQLDSVDEENRQKREKRENCDGWDVRWDSIG